MSSHNEHHSQGNPQPNVRLIPIHVEGRDQPIVNKIPETQKSSSTMPDPPKMQMPHNDNFFNTGGSIFERARDFPIRSSFLPNSNFFSKATSPQRESSPGRQMPGFHTGNQGQPKQQQRHEQTHVPKESSVPRQTPPPQAAQPQAPPHQQQPSAPPPPPQQQQPEQPHTQKSQSQDEIDSAAIPNPPIKEDSITKIQKIQREVLDLMDRVDTFKGATRKDKTYLYLDEMLTQNLLKLDTIDAEGQEHIKQARREAIKCINHCISVLEAKAEAAEAFMNDSGNSLNNSSSNHLAGSGSKSSVKNSESGDKTNMDINATGKSSSGASITHSSSTSSQKQ